MIRIRYDYFLMRVQLSHIGTRLPLKKLAKVLPGDVTFSNPLLLKLGKGYLVILDYAVLVGWGLSDKEMRKWEKKLISFCDGGFEKPKRDELDIKTGSRKQGVYGGEIVLGKLSGSKAVIVSEAIGTSMALEHYEADVEGVLGEFSKIAKGYEREGKTRRSRKQLLKRVGFAMNVQHQAIGGISVLDRPDLAWNDPKLDKLYDSLAQDLELEDRYQLLNKKLELIFQNVEFMLDVIETRHGIFLEWVIVILIAFEIVMFLWLDLH